VTDDRDDVAEHPPDDDPHATVVAELPWDEAWLLRGRLISEDIPAKVFPEHRANPISIAQALPESERMVAELGLGRTSFQVLVPAEHVEQARRIIEGLED
jgi:hypothetical protein